MNGLRTLRTRLLAELPSVAFGLMLLMTAVVFAGRFHAARTPAPWIASNCGTISEGTVIDIGDVSERPRVLVAAFTNTCPACQDDARDLAGPGAAALWSRGLEIRILLMGAERPDGELEKLGALPAVHTVVDPEGLFMTQWKLRGIPCYFLCEYGVVQWCQEGRVVRDQGDNHLLARLAEEWTGLPQGPE